MNTLKPESEVITIGAELEILLYKLFSHLTSGQQALQH